MKVTPCEKKKARKNCFDEQEKLWTFLKMFRKKSFQSHLSRFRPFKPKSFSVSQPWLSTFFRDLGYPNYFSASTPVHSDILSGNWNSFYFFRKIKSRIFESWLSNILDQIKWSLLRLTLVHIKSLKSSCKCTTLQDTKRYT